MQPQYHLVTYTALAIVAEGPIEGIQQVRKQYDPAFDRWPPHINLFFPFVKPQQFQSIFPQLSQLFKDFQSFQMKMVNLDSFPHGVVFIDPITSNNQIQKIYQIIIQKFPFLKGNKEFHPHLTVANKINKNNVIKLKGQLQNNWKQCIIKCQGIHLLQREKDTPFRTAHFIKFVTK